MGFEGIRKGKKPRSFTSDAVEAEVRNTMAIVRSRIKQVMTNLGLDLLFWDGVPEEP